MDQNILHEQIRYYRAQAQEYDAIIGKTADLQAPFARAKELLQQRGPFEHVLELASGTGIWTQVLLPLAREITFLEAQRG